MSSDRAPAPLLCSAPEHCVVGDGVAADYTAALLASLGAAIERVPGERGIHPALEWARSGAMALTGEAAGAPLPAPGALASCARGAVDALALLAGRALPRDLDAPALLGERAGCAGLSRRGRIAPGGSCRLLRGADGFVAVNLARPDDISLLPAWLGAGDVADPWRFVALGLADAKIGEAVERARLLGLPAAVAVPPDPVAPPWYRVAATGTAVAPGDAPPLVIDLSSLWAGPLCSHLLGLAGARVVKVESTGRPDGARRGVAAFFDLLNAGKASVGLDFGSQRGRAQLAGLLARADIVIESARPRALAQLGIDAEEMVANTPGLTWLSITGYGRREPGANWVAFGDDAAVAAGLAVATGGDASPVFCGDAIADPLTGMHAALAAWAAWRNGGGSLLDLSLRDVTAHALAFAPDDTRIDALPGGGGWEVAVGEARTRVAPPRARRPAGRARPLGADTEAVLGEFSAAC